MACRKAQHDRRPAAHDGVEDRFRVLGFDAAVGEHRHPFADRLQVASPRAVGNESGQAAGSRIVRTVRIEIYHQRGPRCSGEPQRCDGTENPVLRRPDGKRRHVSPHRKGWVTVWDADARFKGVVRVMSDQ